MSIESITERIRKEAQAYSDDRRAEAEAVKAEALKTAQAEADRLIPVSYTHLDVYKRQST